MKLLLENWREYLNENKDVSNRLFFMKSAWGAKNNKWDHVGFILYNGKMKDMSGHRGDFVEPIVSTWEDLMKDDTFWKNVEQIPQSPEEAAKMGIYKTMKLPKSIEVPDGIICRTDDPEKKSENCGSFVFNVLTNAGLDASFLKRDEYMVVGKQF
jgi:hypothetical protein